jgi:hypothetical protein
VPALTIGGQVREIRLTIADVEAVEEQLLQRGGRRVLEMFPTTTSRLSMSECRWFIWGAWRKSLPDARIWALVSQFYDDGGTLLELHGPVVDALLECGVFVRRVSQNGAGPPMDPPVGASG